MRRAAVPLALAILATAFSGCLGKDAVPTTVAGVGGSVALVGADGVRVEPDPENGTVVVGLGPDATLGGNLTLAVAGAGGLVFDRAGNATNATLLYRESLGGFEASSGIAAGGPVLGRVHVGTTQVVQVGNANATFVTAAMEGTEVAVFLRGSGKLANGNATILFPLEFQLLVGAGPLTVQLTLTGPGPTLYVAQKAPDGFIVGSVAGAGSNATFDYFVQATRAGTAGFAPVR